MIYEFLAHMKGDKRICNQEREKPPYGGIKFYAGMEMVKAVPRPFSLETHTLPW